MNILHITIRSTMAVIVNIGKYFLLLISLLFITKCDANDILGCGGFVKSHVNLDFSKIEIGLYNKEGSLKEKTECAPTNGYYFLPLYEKGEYVLKVHPPPGWSFEPSKVDLSIDGVSDPCSSGQDINFAFNGFGITGRVITAGQKQGPGGIAVQLGDDKGGVRNTVTTAGGDFHFTPVIPGKYTVKASHPKWKLDPSQAVVQVKEGNTALPVGVLAVKGYDVAGSVTSFGSSIAGVYVLLYSKDESPKFRVEGCNTALLQGVPDAPICHSVTDNNGEFNFGLVPAGEYKLLALSTPPGQVAVSYNVRPDKLPFTVRHDSLFIKNAFEVTGFTLVGSVVSSPGKGKAGVRVLLDGEPVGNSDAAGKFTLANMQPATYVLSFQHEDCQFDDVQLPISSSGPRSPIAIRVARWRVCGSVSAGVSRRVWLRAKNDAHFAVVDDKGAWCVYVPPAKYTVQVEVSDQEQRDGLQFFPVSQDITVNGAVSGVTFSQRKGQLTGTLQCKDRACEVARVALRPLSPDGGYAGPPIYTNAKDGKYTFDEVLPGSAEVSVDGGARCWAEARHNVAVAPGPARVPAFLHTGYVLRVHAEHETQIEYSAEGSSGVWQVPSGASSQCVPEAKRYTLTPRGCHKFEPAQTQVQASADEPPTVYFEASAHAVVVRVRSPIEADDLTLYVDGTKVGPLKALERSKDPYVFEHTLYLADGEVVTVSASSSHLLFYPADEQKVAGTAHCQPSALIISARTALTLRGKIVPAVADVTVNLVSDDVKLVHVTSEDGTYQFGPLDAAKRYKITAEKESYNFGEPDDKGNIVAKKLAEISVELVDDADGTPLEGALVSVSGGSYRRTAAAREGRLRFSRLAAAQYYVKPQLKEYRFDPPHQIVALGDGDSQHLQLRATRVAWSAAGGLGVGGASLRATPLAGGGQLCGPEEATTEPDGSFRIRGLLPNCVYKIELKESNNPDLAGLKLVKAPSTLEVKDKKDIEDISLVAIQPQQLTDASVLIRAASIDHYKSLRLSLAKESAPTAPIYTVKVDSSGYTQQFNPGVMYTLPRLPADNKTYVLQLESSLSKATHSYNDEVHYFNSDGRYKHFTLEFAPKVKSSEQEVRQTSILLIPLLIAVAGAIFARSHIARFALDALNARPSARSPRAPRGDEQRAGIDQVVAALGGIGKNKKKNKIN